MVILNHTYCYVFNQWFAWLFTSTTNMMELYFATSFLAFVQKQAKINIFGSLHLPLAASGRSNWEKQHDSWSTEQLSYQMADQAMSIVLLRLSISSAVKLIPSNSFFHKSFIVCYFLLWILFSLLNLCMLVSRQPRKSHCCNRSKLQ